MKLILLQCIEAILLILLISTIVVSAEIAKENSFYLQSGLGSLSNKDIESPKVLKAGATFPFKTFSIGLSVQIESFEINPKSYNITSLGKGFLEVNSFYLQINHNLHLMNGIPFYLVGGLGVSFYSQDSVNIYEELGYQIDENLQMGISILGGIGANIFITDDIAFSLEIDYIISTAVGTWIVTDTRSSTVLDGDIKENLSRFTLNVGICFYW